MKERFSILFALTVAACSTPAVDTAAPSSTTVESPASMVAKADTGKTVEADPHKGHVDFYSLQKEWTGACQHGSAADERQSPIALADSLFSKSKAEEIKFAYKAADADIVDNGHTLVIKFKQDAGAVTFEGKTFALKQFHFHKTSEHSLNGKFYDMEVHFVFLNDEKDVKAVALGFLVEKGKAPKAWENFWTQVPEHKEGTEEVHEDTLIGSLTAFNVRDLIPKNKYYVYEGSLTTPPCDEFVTHVVATKPLNFSESIISKFAHYHEISNRDLQPLGDAKIRRYRTASEK